MIHEKLCRRSQILDKLLGIVLVCTVSNIASAQAGGKDEKRYSDADDVIITINEVNDSEDEGDAENEAYEEWNERDEKKRESRPLNHLTSSSSSSLLSSSSSSSSSTGLADRCSQQTYSANPLKQFANFCKRLVTFKSPDATGQDSSHANVKVMPDEMVNGIRGIVGSYLDLEDLETLSHAGNSFVPEMNGYEKSFKMIWHLLINAKKAFTIQDYKQLKADFDDLIEDLRLMSSNISEQHPKREVLKERIQAFRQQIQVVSNQVTQILLDQSATQDQFYVHNVIASTSQNQQEVQNTIFDLAINPPAHIRNPVLLNMYRTNLLSSLASHVGRDNPELRRRIYEQVHLASDAYTEEDRAKILGGLAASASLDSTLSPNRTDLLALVDSFSSAEKRYKYLRNLISSTLVSYEYGASKDPLVLSALASEDLKKMKSMMTASIIKDNLERSKIPYQNDGALDAIVRKIKHLENELTDDQKNWLVITLAYVYPLQSSHPHETFQYLVSYLNKPDLSSDVKFFIYAALVNDFKDHPEWFTYLTDHAASEEKALEFLSSDQFSYQLLGDFLHNSDLSSIMPFGNSYFMNLGYLAIRSSELSPKLQDQLIPKLKAYPTHTFRAIQPMANSVGGAYGAYIGTAIGLFPVGMIVGKTVRDQFDLGDGVGFGMAAASGAVGGFAGKYIGKYFYGPYLAGKLNSFNGRGLSILAHRAPREDVQAHLFKIASESPNHSTELLSALAANSIHHEPRQWLLLNILRNVKDKNAKLSILRPLAIHFSALSTQIQEELKKIVDEYNSPKDTSFDLLRIRALIESATLPAELSY